MGAAKAAVCLHDLFEEDVHVKRRMCRMQNLQKRVMKIAVTDSGAYTKSAPLVSG